MSFDSFNKCALSLAVIGLLAGCSGGNWKSNASTWAQNIAKNDCHVYKRSTSQYDECVDKVNALYEEHYSTENIIDRR